MWVKRHAAMQIHTGKREVEHLGGIRPLPKKGFVLYYSIEYQTSAESGT